MPEPFPNIYHKRQVAATAPKPCFICFKSTCIVLITPDNKDFFYSCAGHLLDRGFAIPAGTAGVDAVKQAEEERAKEAERTRREALDKEIEKIKKEYEEKKKKRKDKDKSDDKEDKEKDDKIKKLEADSNKKETIEVEKKEEDGPRIFNLHKSVYQMRVNRVRQAQMAKRDREAMQKLGGFPAVPKGMP